MDQARIVEILCRYRHETLAEDEIEIIPDLQIVNVFAARVQGRLEYVVRADEGIVEEVAFDGWPPSRPDDREMSPVESVMSRTVYVCTAEQTLADAARILWERDCGCLPVCGGPGGDRLEGIITDRDVCMAALFTRRPLHDIRVGNAMPASGRASVRTCRADEPLSNAVAAMRDGQVRRLPVVDAEDRLVGMLSLADSARAAGESDLAAAVGETLAAICRPRVASESAAAGGGGVERPH
ncbi:MAG TPA: CBS domain-containing protein [Gammaproteobacteria bacterium]|nr:CBS domain-containing protein [Gammaproteobacteria bacterium]